GLVGEHADVELTGALHLALDRHTSRFDLPRGDVPASDRLEREVAERDVRAALRQTVRTAGELLAELGALGLKHDRVSSGAESRATALRKDLALEDPALHADGAVRGLRGCHAELDVGAQGVQGDAALAVLLGARDLGSAEPAA